jgi:hypothetical protein
LAPKLRWLATLALLMLTGLAAAPATAASGFFKNFVVLNGQYSHTIQDGTVTGIPALTGISSLGSFDRSTGSLRLGGEVNTFSDNTDDLQSAQLFYRVYLQGSAAGNFVSLGLALQNTAGNNKKWVSGNDLPNLLAATANPGRYVLELYFQASGTYSNAGGHGAFDIYDSAGGNNYTVVFDVTGNAPMLWTGRVNTDWFNPANCSSNNVPGSTTDVTIPLLPSGRDPIITSGVAQVRNLRIEGANGAIGSHNYLQGGELQIFGDFQDPSGSFGQTGGVFVLAGSTQTFDGGSFFDVRIQGGGTKTLTNRMDVLQSLTMVDGIIATRTDNAVAFNVDLAGTAQILGESDRSYVLGFLRARNRTVVQNVPNAFGNIGIELTSNGSPGLTLVTRVTSVVYAGAGQSRSIRRGFIFTPNNPEGQTFTLSFRYLDSELNGIAEDDLALFRSLNGNIPFVNLRRTSLDPTANTLTRTGITGPLSATFTLGDNTNPLPVTVSSFAAVAQGPDALLTWTTAQETNNQGFEVQASTDGIAFHKLGFVASETRNSSTPRTYQFRDATPGKQGLRYYRLRQLDSDGQNHFYGPRTVVFGTAARAAVQAYPNPFGSEITLALQTAAPGPATVSVLDGTGRPVRTWRPALEAGSSQLHLADLAALAHGVYVVQVQYNDGQTQRLKLVKN